MIKSTELTQAYYNGISKGYKNLYHNEQIEKINSVKQYFLNKGSILDLGSGDGVLNEFIPLDSQLYSYDLSDELLKLNSNSDEFKFQGNCEKLLFEDNFFDGIYSFSVTQDVVNISKAVNEIQRVGKNNCLCIISFVRWGSRVDEIKELIKSISNEILFEEELEKDYIYVFKLKK